ncbi:MAG: PEP/pyruvate-binding domain-containing protein [Candidatus Doudnabacteria bacterium]
MYIKVFKQLNKNSVSEAGGKGASLGEMAKAKIPVPPGYVVLASAFDHFLEETDLDSEIEDGKWSKLMLIKEL